MEEGEAERGGRLRHGIKLKKKCYNSQQQQLEKLTGKNETPQHRRVIFHHVCKAISLLDVQIVHVNHYTDVYSTLRG